MTATGSSNRRVYVTARYADIALARDYGCSTAILYQYLSLKMGSNSSAWPSYAVIMRDTGFAKATISKALSNLEAIGAITVERKHRSVSHYTVQELPDSLQVPPPLRSETEHKTSSETEHQETSVEETSVYSETSSPHSGTPPRARTEKQKARDDLAEALGREWGGIPNVGESCHTLFWKTVSGYQSMGCTPEQLTRAHHLYRERHPTWDCTMTAVAKHARSLLAHQGQPATAAPLTNFQQAALNVRKKLGLDDDRLQPLHPSDGGHVIPAHASNSGVQLGRPASHLLSSPGPSEGGAG